VLQRLVMSLGTGRADMLCVADAVVLAIEADGSQTVCFELCNYLV
jgi:hypothetical protein